MELKDFLELLKKEWRLAAFVALLTVSVTAIATYMLPTKYRSSIDVYVKRAASQESGEYYTYDGYYSSQSAIGYTETVAGFFESLQEVRKAAQMVELEEEYEKSVDDPSVLSEDVDYLETIQDRIVVDNLAPQVLLAQYTDKNEENSKIWIKNLGAQVSKTVEELNANGDNDYEVDISTEPLTKVVTPSWTINLIAGLMAGMTFGVMAVFLKNYFKE